MTRRFVSVDWGTSRLRVCLVDGDEVLASSDSADGIARLSLEPEFRQVMMRRLDEFIRQLGADAESLPVVISGMASSSLGIRELSYARLPFPLDGSGAIHAWLDESKLLVSGLAGNADVMRGEETQLIGLHALGYGNGDYILPGTHSKHLTVADGALVDFTTYMTGEWFELLAAHSTLRDCLGPPLGTAGSTFIKAVEVGAAGNLLHSIFTVRALILLGSLGPEHGRERLSGLLIGYELSGLQKRADSAAIYLAATGELGVRYLKAAEVLGLNWQVVPEADWNQATRRGQLCLLNRIEAETPR